MGFLSISPRQPYESEEEQWLEVLRDIRRICEEGGYSPLDVRTIWNLGFAEWHRQNAKERHFDTLKIEGELRGSAYRYEETCRKKRDLRASNWKQDEQVRKEKEL